MADDDTGTTAAIRGARRLCFFAHYHPHGIAAEHVLLHLAALAEAGFTVVVLSTATMPPAEAAKLRAVCALLIERENRGLDFGGWIEAVARFFPIEAELLLFANDSVYAPVGDLPGFIDRLVAVPADFYGAVESLEGAPHLQSWFLLFRPAAYRSPAFAALLGTPIPPDMPKAEIIARYEMGLTPALVAAGLRYHAAYSPSRHGLIAAAARLNAGQLLWRELIADGMPFLKIELLRDNPLHVPGLDAWPAAVGRRAPALVPAIRDDLARRRTAGGVGAPVGPWDTRDQPNPAFWPELQPVMRRDYLQGGRVRLRHRLNALAWPTLRWLAILRRDPPWRGSRAALLRRLRAWAGRGRAG